MNNDLSLKLKRLFSSLMVLNTIIMLTLIVVMIYSYKSHYNALISYGHSVIRAIEGSRPVFLNNIINNEHQKQLFNEMFDTNILLDIIISNEDGRIFILNDSSFNLEHLKSSHNTVENLDDYIIIHKPLQYRPPAHIANNRNPRHHIQPDSTITLIISKNSLNKVSIATFIIIFFSLSVEMLIFYLYRHTNNIITLYNESTIKLQKAEKEALTGRLASILAHEIKNPLSSISGLISYAEDNESNTKLKNVLSTAQDQIKRLSAIVNDFLSYGRSIELDLEDIDIRTLTEKSITLLHHDIIKKNLSININGDDFQCMIDKNKMLQVLVNLLLNAIEASPENSEIEIVLDSINKKMSLKNDIVDSQEFDKDNIFNPFYTTKQSGSGLGLSITQRIVETHGYTISLDNYNPFIISINFKNTR